ncbi:sugar kinase [Dyella sp. Tek66A03]|uniref:sugar kinase n=1 Tax=Dyella sp. Tek66A03 TaxID=3458298 RepID=UPI00403E7074
MRLSPPGNELLLQSPGLKVHFGGAEANVAASLAILGHRSVMVSTLPDHAIGRACAGELQRHGVGTAIRFVDGRMGLYFLTPGAMQRPAEVLYDRAGSAFASASRDSYDWPSLLSGAQWLHLSGINLALGPNTAQAALDAARAARVAGVSISFDCNYHGKLWGARANEAPALLHEMVTECNLVFGDDRDIALILGNDFAYDKVADRFSAAAAAAFKAWPHLRRLATTERHYHSVDRQDVRAMCASNDAIVTTRSFALNGIVDRMGAGDAFAAGFLHGLLGRTEDAATLDFAIAAFCLKHSVAGDVNLLRESEIRSFLTEQGFEVRR